MNRRATAQQRRPQRKRAWFIVGAFGAFTSRRGCFAGNMPCVSVLGSSFTSRRSGFDWSGRRFRAAVPSFHRLGFDCRRALPGRRRIGGHGLASIVPAQFLGYIFVDRA
jgi:hypothetical protein